MVEGGHGHGQDLLRWGEHLRVCSDMGRASQNLLRMGGSGHHRICSDRGGKHHRTCSNGVKGRVGAEVDGLRFITGLKSLCEGQTAGLRSSESSFTAPTRHHRRRCPRKVGDGEGPTGRCSEHSRNVSRVSAWS